MARIEELEQRLDEIADLLVVAVEGFVQTVIIAIAEELLPASPVDTGAFRGNWRPSLNAPIEFPISFLDPTGAATVARIKQVARRWRTGDEFFIVNALDYAVPLINGSSPQADADFHIQAIEDGFAVAVEFLQTEGLQLGG